LGSQLTENQGFFWDVTLCHWENDSWHFEGK